ncbi:MAG: DUF4864 domain-containing protein [Boseongicola sp.]|nr:DUF4864 domain-containing protein [Boseongicola sp.]NNJ68365.1 DUF4864 domain-containing protein [Boseongicola sp.]
MRQLVFAISFWIGWSGSLYGAEVLPSEPAIEGTIQSQIEAFQADDFDGAFTYASPNIQTLFRSPDNFGSMVKNGYPMVWRPDELRFLELREIAGNLWQKVLIRDGAGTVHILDYQMIQTPEGWRINGVQLLRAPDVGA